MTPAELAAKGLRVKPLVLDVAYFVVHASGHFSFFTSESEAEAYGYSLGRGYYYYADTATVTYGDRLRKAHEEWQNEEQKCHLMRILSAIEPAPSARIAAMIEETPHDQT